MEFRWLILLTLWTALAGPILARPSARTIAIPSKPIVESKLLLKRI
jgi:hypothetical protein